jgi:hypothetical protein
MECGESPQLRASATSDPTEDLHQNLLNIAADKYSIGNRMRPDDTDPMPITDYGKQPDVEVFSYPMKAKGPTTPEGKFVLAILSADDYPRLHLSIGMNYVYKVTSGTDFKFVLVPERPKAKMFYLEYTVISAKGHAPPPHLIRLKVGEHVMNHRLVSDYVIGGCIDNCGAGHCATADAKVEFTAAEAARWGLKN